MNKNMRLVRAFSMIEIVVVIAIISILAFIAVSSYKEHVASSAIITSAISLEPFKNEVFKQHINGVVFGTATEILIASASADKPKYLDQLVRGEYGCLELQYDLDALGLPSNNSEILTLVYCPQTNSQGDMVEWVCGYSTDTTTEYITYLPEACQQAVAPDTSF